MRMCTRILVAEPTNAFRCTYLLNRLGACGAFLKPEEILLDFFRLFPIFWCAVAILPSTNTVRIVGEETMLSRRPDCDSWFVVETFSGEGNPTRKVSRQLKQRSSFYRWCQENGRFWFSTLTLLSIQNLLLILEYEKCFGDLLKSENIFYHLCVAHSWAF